MPYVEALDTRRFDVGASGQTLLGERVVVTARAAAAWQRHDHAFRPGARARRPRHGSSARSRCAAPPARTPGWRASPYERDRLRSARRAALRLFVRRARPVRAGRRRPGVVAGGLGRSARGRAQRIRHVRQSAAGRADAWRRLDQPGVGRPRVLRRHAAHRGDRGRRADAADRRRTPRSRARHDGVDRSHARLRPGHGHGDALWLAHRRPRRSSIATTPTCCARGPTPRPTPASSCSARVRHGAVAATGTYTYVRAREHDRGAPAGCVAHAPAQRRRGRDVGGGGRRPRRPRGLLHGAPAARGQSVPPGVAPIRDRRPAGGEALRAVGASSSMPRTSATSARRVGTRWCGRHAAPMGAGPWTPGRHSTAG